MSIPTIEQLHKALTYDPKTGVFTRLRVNYSTHRINQEAGTLNRAGYRQISVRSKLQYGHKLAWMFVYGYWPTGDIDHINGDKSDNRISNLRLASRSQNMQNTGLRCSNTSGFKGVWFFKRTGRWMAGIKVNGNAIHLGYFDSPEDAAMAYDAKARELFGEFCKPQIAA